MRRSFWFGVLAGGFAGIVSQIVVLREAFSSFYGNELVLGFVLANWLFLVGVGTYFGRRISVAKARTPIFIYTLLGQAVIAPTLIVLIRLVKPLVSVSGELMGLSSIMVYSLLILSPFCILSGFQFSLAASIAKTGDKRSARDVSNVYVATVLGSLLGGVTASLLLIVNISSFQLTYVVSLVCFASFLWLARNHLSGLNPILFSTSFILLIILFVRANPETYTQGLIHPKERILFSKESVYGRIVVTEGEGQLNFYSNNVPVFSSGNQQSIEEKVHFAMLSHEHPGKVLLVSGGVSGSIKEILKYDVEFIDYVELDPTLVLAGARFTDNLGDDRVRIVYSDARVFVRVSEELYDIVIIDVPDPDSLQLNRYYTFEFFRDVKKILSKDGVVSVSISSGENYLSESERVLNSVLYRTLKMVFDNILIIPGSPTYYLSSDAHLSYSSLKDVSSRGIESEYFEYYALSRLTSDRISDAKKAALSQTKVNTDFSPTSMFPYIQYWLSIFGLNVKSLFGILLIFTVLGLLASGVKPIPLTIFITGFTAMSLEVILILTFQVIHGFVFYMIGLIVTCFMAGNVFGAWIGNSRIYEKNINPVLLARFDLILSMFCLLLVFTVQVRDGSTFMIPIMIAVLGFLVGIEYPLAVKLLVLKKAKADDVAGRLAAIDLFGACIGAVLTSLFLVPFWGIIKSIILIGSLNLVGGIIIYLKEK